MLSGENLDTLGGGLGLEAAHEGCLGVRAPTCRADEEEDVSHQLVVEHGCVALSDAGLAGLPVGVAGGGLGIVEADGSRGGGLHLLLRLLLRLLLLLLLLLLRRGWGGRAACARRRLLLRHLDDFALGRRRGGGGGSLLEERVVLVEELAVEVAADVGRGAVEAFGASGGGVGGRSAVGVVVRRKGERQRRQERERVRGPGLVQGSASRG